MKMSDRLARGGRWNPSSLRCGLTLIAFLFALRAAHAADAPTAKASAPSELCAPMPAVEKRSQPLGKKEKKQHAKYMQDALAAYEGRRFAEAAIALRAAYLLDPQVDVLYSLAQACREAGQLAQSLPLYEQAGTQTSDAETRADAQRHITGLRTELAKQEDARAAKLEAERDFTAAAATWEAAYLFRPEPLYLFRRAQALRQGGQLPSALAMYQRFLDAAPHSEQANEAKTRIIELRGAEQAERAAKLDADGKFAEAAAAWQSAYEQTPNPQYLFQLAESQRQQGERTAAIASYDRFLKADDKKQDPELHQRAAEYAAALRAGRAIMSPQMKANKTEKPIYKKWWFWTAVGLGAAAVAGGVTAGVLASRPAPDPFIGLTLDGQQMTQPSGQ